MCRARYVAARFLTWLAGALRCTTRNWTGKHEGYNASTENEWVYSNRIHMRPTSLPTNNFDTLVSHARHCSRYFARLLDAEPAWLDVLRAQHLLATDAALIERWLDELPAADETGLTRALRTLRKRVMLHLILRDLGGLCDLSEVMRAMTALANSRYAARRHSAWQIWPHNSASRSGPTAVPRSRCW